MCQPVRLKGHGPAPKAKSIAVSRIDEIGFLFKLGGMMLKHCHRRLSIVIGH